MWKYSDGYDTIKKVSFEKGKDISYVWEKEKNR